MPVSSSFLFLVAMPGFLVTMAASYARSFLLLVVMPWQHVSSFPGAFGASDVLLEVTCIDPPHLRKE